MTHDQVSLTERVEELIQQVTLLTDRVGRLEHQTQSIEKPIQSAVPIKKPSKQAEKPILDNEMSLLVSGSSLLKHISAICFLLVIGLGLRALGDNGLINMQLGTILGIGYASLLIGAGFALYRRSNSMAPLLTITGAILMFSVLVETHIRFSSMPVEIVYLLMAVTGIVMAFISFDRKVSLPIIVGTLGMCWTAVIIDYPNPYFPYLGLMLWLSNILGFFASRIKRCSWLRWLLMLTTHFMLQVWGLKISGIFSSGDKLNQLAPGWFIPIITLIGFTFVMISLFGIIRSGEEKISKFDYMLPVINAGWCYIAGMYALKNPALFGIPAAIAAVFHFGLAFWLARRKRINAPGTNTFIAGGVILTGLSLPALTGGMLLPLPVLALLALIICIFSNTWGSGGMRMTSYILQGYVSIILFTEIFGSTISEPFSIFIVALICFWAALEHYKFCRQTPPPENSTAFSRYDRKDQAALLPLFSSLINALIGCLALGFFILSRAYAGDINIAYIGLQSLLINSAAALLMIFAFWKQNKEIRNVAIIVMMAGGLKVIIFDLLQISGTWLVIGIFAFGVAAALQSILLARWKPDTNPPAGLEKDQSPPG